MVGKNNDAIQKDLIGEMKTHHDILQGDFEDKYENLPIKHTFGLKWVASQCSHVRYLLKADDDIVMNLPYLQSILQERPLVRTMIGIMNSKLLL